MLCDQIVEFFKRHITLPGTVLVFAGVWLIMLAVEAGATGAAWVQAIGSILALIAAGLLPVAHQRMNDKRRGEERLLALSHLVDEALYEIWILSSCFTSPKQEFQQMSHYVRFGRPNNWPSITAGLNEIKLSELPPPRAADLIKIRGAVAYAAYVSSQVTAWLAEGHANPEVIAVLRSKRDLLALMRCALPLPVPEHEKERRAAIFAAELAQGGSDPTNVGGLRFYTRFERSKIEEVPRAVYIQPVFPNDAMASAPMIITQDELGWGSADEALTLAIREAVARLQSFDPQFPG